MTESGGRLGHHLKRIGVAVVIVGALWGFVRYHDAEIEREWRQFVAVYPAADLELPYTRVPIHVKYVRPDGSRHSFRSGSKRNKVPAMELGFDRTAFWLRTRPGHTGPSEAIRVPWSAVRRCGRFVSFTDLDDPMELEGVVYGLDVADLDFANACKALVASASPQ